MYEALLGITQDLNTLDATLNAPDSQQRVARIVAAFDETANKLSAATQSAGSDHDRITFQKLYRGMIAARRIVLSLHERHAQRQSAG
jgi:hypothetical protein